MAEKRFVQADGSYSSSGPITVVSNDPNLVKYDDANLAKIAEFIGQDSLDQALAGFKSKQKFTIGDLLKRLGIKSDELSVNTSATLIGR